MLTLPLSETLKSLCLQLSVIPLTLTERKLSIASDTPLTLQTINMLRFAANREVETILWPRAKYQHHLADFSKSLLAEPQKITSKQVLNETASYYAESSTGDENTIIHFVDHILTEAINQRASDIHFEPYRHYYRIRFRIDGVLQTITTPALIMANGIAARLKILAKLDIAERRLPQDGQLTFCSQQKEHVLRIATLPILEGEKIVLRIMSSHDNNLCFSELGMSSLLQSLYLSTLMQPQGLILVTGPTGSGKTVTLYSGIQTINQVERNICSVEDPIEMEIEGINQVQVNAKVDLTFHKALRAFLRQDPDVIMVGEIRDKETAQIAINAAQTGHLVLSTLHTNSAVDTLIRLQQMGIAPYLTISALKLVIAQRLARRLCTHCRIQGANAITINTPYWQGDVPDWHAQGCEYCIGGYHGRIGIYEHLQLSPPIKQALLQQVTLPSLEALAIEHGLQPLITTGLQLVCAGITCLSEIYRVLGDYALNKENGITEHAP